MMDYDSLTVRVEQFANRNDAAFIDQIPDFIDQAINRIYSEAESIGFEILKQGNLNAENILLAKPCKWKKTISFSIVGDVDGVPQTRLLLPRSLEFGLTYSPTQITGVPKFYSDAAYDAFVLTPAPLFAYPFNLIYHGLPEFNALNQTNFLTERYPNLLLYGTLVEVLPFLKDDGRASLIESFYNRELTNINRDKQFNTTDRTSEREAT